MGAAPSVAHTAGNSGAGDLQQHASANFAPSDEEVRQRRKELGLDDDPSPAAPIVPAPHLSSPFSSFQKRRIRLFSGGSVGTWRKGPVIGKGATGAVYEAIDDATQGVFAVKEIQFAEDFADNPEDRRRFDALRAEVSLLQQVDHPNVVRFLGIDRVGFNMYIMMEFVAGGNVQSLVKRFKRLPEELAAKYAFQIVAGLTYLHAKNIIHRDIKGANILVSDDGILKLADFGAAKKIMDPEQLQHTLAGTPYWMAPEVVRQEGHGKPADVWSLGGTVLQMLTGKAPYQDLPPVAALFKIGHGTELPIPSDAVLSPLARDFVAQCLERDAARRPPVEALIEHPWLRNAKVALQPYYAAATAPTSPLGGVFSSGHASETASLQSSYRGVPPKEESPGGATQVAAEHPVSLEEGLVMEYVIALSFTHDDDAALAAVLAAQQSQAVFIEPSATRAVRFDGDLSTGGGGRAGGHDEEEVYLDGEFNQDQFDAFVGALGKDDASQ